MLRYVALGGNAHNFLKRYLKCPLGTLDRIAAMGRMYAQYAAAEPGAFRLMFGLREGHAKYGELVQTGDDTFAVVQTK